MDTALILAGGESRRLGRAKALVEIGGKPMVRRVAEVMIPLTQELVVSVASAEMEERIRSHLPDAVFVRDQRPGSGPIEGFRQGFRAARGEVVLVAPCDAPLLRPGLYSLLLNTLDDYDAAVPKFEVVDPVRAVYRRTRVLDVLHSDPDTSSPSGLVDRLRAVFVTADQIRSTDATLSSFVDVNTFEDLRSAIGKVRSPADDSAGDTSNSRSP